MSDAIIIVLCSVALLLSFYALHRVTDLYFVESLELISQRLKMTSDIAGATLVAGRYSDSFDDRIYLVVPSLCVMAIGFVIGMVFGLMSLNRHGLIRWPAIALVVSTAISRRLYSLPPVPGPRTYHFGIWTSRIPSSMWIASRIATGAVRAPRTRASPPSVSSSVTPHAATIGRGTPIEPRKSAVWPTPPASLGQPWVMKMIPVTTRRKVRA